MREKHITITLTFRKYQLPTTKCQCQSNSCPIVNQYKVWTIEGYLLLTHTHTQVDLEVMEWLRRFTGYKQKRKGPSRKEREAARKALELRETLYQKLTSSQVCQVCVVFCKHNSHCLSTDLQSWTQVVSQRQRNVSATLKPATGPPALSAQHVFVNEM